MNNPELMCILFIGMLLMCGMISLQMKWYGITAWKSMAIVIVLIAVGLFGSKLWYYIENQTFRGRSFFGVVFLVPVVFYPVAKILRIKYSHTLDFCAPAGCLTLALVKIQCLKDGCCAGKVLYIDGNNNYVKFPSQIVEMVVFLLLAGFLLKMSEDPRKRRKVFPMFLVLYGASRFVLDFWRGGTTPFAVGLSAGSFWALLSFICGVVVASIMKLKEIHHE